MYTYIMYIYIHIYIYIYIYTFVTPASLLYYTTHTMVSFSTPWRVINYPYPAARRPRYLYITSRDPRYMG